jgi:hypothetical protein
LLGEVRSTPQQPVGSTESLPDCRSEKGNLPINRKFEAGKTGRKHLIKSDPPERESAAKVVLELESTEEIGTETV